MLQILLCTTGEYQKSICGLVIWSDELKLAKGIRESETNMWWHLLLYWSWSFYFVVRFWLRVWNWRSSGSSEDQACVCRVIKFADDISFIKLWESNLGIFRPKHFVLSEIDSYYGIWNNNSFLCPFNIIHRKTMKFYEWSTYQISNI